MNIIAKAILEVRRRKAETAAQLEAARQREEMLAMLRQEVLEIATMEHWDPNEPWIKALSDDLHRWPEHLGATFLRRMIYRVLDADTYIAYDYDGSWRVTARYDGNETPTPIDVLKKTYRSISEDQLKRFKIVIGSHETHLIDAEGKTRFKFVGHGRKMHYGDMFRAENASRLIKDLTGVDIAIKTLAQRDLGRYNNVIITYDDNKWNVHYDAHSYSA